MGAYWRGPIGGGLLEGVTSMIYCIFISLFTKVQTEVRYKFVIWVLGYAIFFLSSLVLILHSVCRNVA